MFLEPNPKPWWSRHWFLCHFKMVFSPSYLRKKTTNKTPPSQKSTLAKGKTYYKMCAVHVWVSLRSFLYDILSFFVLGHGGIRTLLSNTSGSTSRLTTLVDRYHGWLLRCNNWIRGLGIGFWRRTAGNAWECHNLRSSKHQFEIRNRKSRKKRKQPSLSLHALFHPFLLTYDTTQWTVNGGCTRFPLQRDLTFCWDCKWVPRFLLENLQAGNFMKKHAMELIHCFAPSVDP